MKAYWNYIKFILLLTLVSGLFSFANYRNGKRILEDTQIKIFNQNTPFITDDDVRNLLIQNDLATDNKPKEILDLNSIESLLSENETIKKADVFLSVKGELVTQIHQKKPIARVYTNESFYIDSEGTMMPLSKNYSARVPFVIGNVSKSNFKNAYEFSKLIYKDEFLKSMIYEIKQSKDETLSFKIRGAEFIVEVGGINQLEKKINNFKAFYQKAKKNNLLSKYAKVNLKFTSQVICSKK